MDTVRFQQMLSLLLLDPGNATYTVNEVIEAQNEAIRDYSRYMPLIRAFGTGSLYSFASVNDTSIKLVGGGFKAGDIVTLEPFSPFSDGVYTLSSPVKVDAQNLNTGQAIQFNVTPNIAVAHSAGVNVYRQSLGLVLVANQTAYAMPYDFLTPDYETLNIGLGLRSASKEFESFYGGVYRNSNRTSGIGLGAAQNFSGIGGLGASDAFFNPQMGLMDATSIDPMSYFFSNTTPVMLNFYNTPTLLNTIEFNYIAEHIPETIPDADIDALLNRAAYSCMTGRIAKLATRLDWKDDDVSEKPSDIITAIAAAAKQHMAVFEDRIKKNPVVLSG